MDDGNNSKGEVGLKENIEETLQLAENSNSKPEENFGEEFGCVDGKDSDKQSREFEGNGSIPVAGEEEMNTRASSPPKTLAEVPSASNDLHCNFEVPVVYDLQTFEAEENKDHISVSKQGDLKDAKDQAAPAQRQREQKSPDGPFSSELSPSSVVQSISSIQSLPEQGPIPVENRNLSCVPVMKQSLKPFSVPAQKTPYPDGYNWRKYGQKQVKSPQGSRSYYRCTYSKCSAKKIECSDNSNRVIEIVYRSCHNHDPPEKLNSNRGSKGALSVVPVNGIDPSVHPVGALDDAAPSSSSKDPGREAPPVMESREQDSSGCEENPGSDVKQEPLNEPETRKRLKKSVSSCSEPSSKPGKDPEYVVHAAGDVGISGDGYRWRKYGQKMVKGNPHPRNYYRCTSAGCTVRKHIEMAKDNSNGVIITYKGRHDHDMPVPKKHHGPPSVPLIAASASSPASVNTSQVTKSETCQDQVSAARWSADKEGGELTSKPSETGGEKAMESARTLLSIGFEIKPCSGSV
uniref:WRKY32 n=1 Tax=Catharanthus roseus TaxID=4058 RepID=K7PFQ7_CATRO|nr:WRKY32 [Catharanthus roseus]